MLEEAESDVLILLDCCTAASSAAGTGNGITELIAACGFETWAPGVGEHSFTRSLIDELNHWSRVSTPLTAAMLHNQVISRVKYWNPRFNTPSRQESFKERRKTPVYIVLSNEAKKRSIELLPFESLLSETKSITRLRSSPELSSLSEDPLSPSHSSLSTVWPDHKFDYPKVLISVALDEDQVLHTQSWIEWLSSLPAITKYTHVEGIYKSDSIVLIISLPVVIWDLIPNDPAISFVAFVKSRNLIEVKDYNKLSTQYQGKEQVVWKGKTGSEQLEPSLVEDTESMSFDGSSILPPLSRYVNYLSSPHTSHLQELQHQLGTKSLAYQILQGEHDKLLAAFSRLQARCATLDRKSQANETEVFNLAEEKARMQAQINAYEN